MQAPVKEEHRLCRPYWGCRKDDWRAAGRAALRLRAGLSAAVVIARRAAAVMGVLTRMAIAMLPRLVEQPGASLYRCFRTVLCTGVPGRGRAVVPSFATCMGYWRSIRILHFTAFGAASLHWPPRGTAHPLPLPIRADWTGRPRLGRCRVPTSARWKMIRALAAANVRPLAGSRRRMHALSCYLRPFPHVCRRRRPASSELQYI